MPEVRADIPLNEAQRRHYAVLLATLEEAVSELEVLAAGRHRAGRLKSVDADLPLGIESACRPHLDAIRRDLTALGNRLALEPGTQSAARKFQALALTSEVQLEDSSAKSLRAYGLVDARVAEVIDPVIARMHRSFSALAALVGQTRLDQHPR